MFARAKCITEGANRTLKPWFYQGQSVGNLSTTYTEYSGLTHPTKIQNKNYLWAIEDGATTYFLAINRNSAALAGKWTISGLTTSDIEDCASANVKGVNYLYLADIGDNGNARSTITIYRVLEPTITGSDGTISSVETITCQYPAGDLPSHKDAECLLVDPDTGDMYIITKRISPIKCYKLAHQSSYSGTQTLVSMGAISNDSVLNTLSTTSANSGGANGYVTGGNISPNGSEIVLRSYFGLYVWRRNKSSESIYQCLSRTYDSVLTHSYVGGGGNVTLTTPPKNLHPYGEPQGESFSFDYEGINCYTCSEYIANEGSSASSYPLFRYSRLDRNPTVATFRNGENSYNGTYDTFIDSSTPSTDNGASTSLVCDYDYSAYPTISRTRAGLIRWDLSSIPTGSTVVGAYINFYINTEGKQFAGYKLLTGWTSGSTYNSLNGGISTNGTDASSSYDWLYGVTTASAGIDSYTGLVRVNLPLATVQQWISYPVTNSGYYIPGGPTESTGDGLQLSSSKTGAVGQRPQMVVSYY